jgi:hypothetical protein
VARGREVARAVRNLERGKCVRATRCTPWK